MFFTVLGSNWMKKNQFFVTKYIFCRGSDNFLVPSVEEADYEGPLPYFQVIIIRFI